MICSELHDHFRERGTWVDWDRATDRFTAGDPSRAVTKVAVSWKASLEALRVAHERGAELFVSHESICVKAVNGADGPERQFALPTEAAKFEWLDETGMVVYRCHDFWDRYPGTGVRDSWRDGLALEGEVIADAYPLYVTRVASVRLDALARHVLGKIRDLGQDGVLVTGDGAREVTRVATGTGVTVDPPRMKELGAEVGVLTCDYYLHVRMGVHAAELEFPTILVDHGVAEEWGVRNLATYLAGQFPGLEVFHIPYRCGFRVLA